MSFGLVLRLMNRASAILLVVVVGIMATGIYITAAYSAPGFGTQQRQQEGLLTSTSSSSSSSSSASTTSVFVSSSLTKTSTVGGGSFPYCPCGGGGTTGYYYTSTTATPAVSTSVTTTYSSRMMSTTTMMTNSNNSSNWMMYPTATVNISQAISLMKNPPSYIEVVPSNNTLIFTQSQNITILVLGLMPDYAQNLTGMQSPSYSTGDVFVIYGLINPTVVIPKGASPQFIFVNLDDDMYHNLVLTSLAPPYSYMSMMGGGGMMGGGSGTFYTMMPMLYPADYNSGIAHAFAFHFTLSNGGTLWYVCTYPGHAQSGMYGKIFVGDQH